MPRHRKPQTQAPQTPGLEAGAAYTEVSDSLAAQAAIPLEQEPPVGGGPLPAVQAAPPAPPPPPEEGSLPLDAARGFTPNITPLTAPGQGLQRPSVPFRITNEMRAANLLQEWAENSDHPEVMDAAMQMEVYLRNG
jgi:hypothetical protein